MTLISSSIPNFVNGVSQQPFTLRLASQLEDQVNGLSTVSRGLKKRPPTQHIARLINTPLSSAFLHTISRDGTEKYTVVIQNNSIRVFDLDGVEKTVNCPDGTSYLTGLFSAAGSISAVTVADYTFVVNRTKTITASTTLSSGGAYTYSGMFNVKLGNYGKTYSLYLNGNMVATYTTLDGSSASHSSSISTDNIASQLYTDFSTFKSINAPAYNNYHMIRYGSVLFIYSDEPFNIKCVDGFNGNAMVAINGSKVQRFTDLPNTTQGNVKVEITGDVSNTFDNYWVVNEGASGNPAIWKETVAPNISVGLNASTMPHVLIREADGTFTFKRATWDNRIVGDAESNPHPSFVGRKINDVFFFRNRLGFLSDENVILSEAGEFFNFYRTTVTQLLDGDPIDVAVSTNKVAILRHAIPFEKKLYLYSDQTQFVIDQNEILTPKTVAIDTTTEYPCSTAVKPVASGNSIYFVSERGRYSAVREYFVDNNNDSSSSVEVTAHVPEYIPSGVFKMASAPNEEIILILSTTTRNKLWVYKHFTANSEKLQSSWSTWEFPTTDTILHAEFINSEVFLVISRSTGVFLEKLDVAADMALYPEPYLVLLDRKVVVNVAQLSYASGYTTIGSLPYTPSDGNYYLVAREDNGSNSGKLLPVIWDGTTARVVGNLTTYTGTFSFGRSYTSSFKLSPVTIKEQMPGGGLKSDTEGRLQVRKIGFNFSDTGFFKVNVTPEGRDTYTYTYTGRRLGSSAVIGEVKLNTDKFTVPVVSRNTSTTIELINDLPIPCSFLSADWEGFYARRSKTV